MRGFLAFGLDAPFSAELAAFAATLPREAKLEPLAAADYHVTIKFLSEFSSTKFVECLGELTALGAPPAHALRAGKLALWPTVLALECEASAELADWHARVNALLERKGFLHERHPRFHPHVTLARRKAGFRLPAVEELLETSGSRFAGRAVEVGAPLLWRTEPDGTGRRHLPYLSPLF
jgi:2'-5' RNA ligase